ncbi:MAG TPA: dodecin [Gammaproteobacteria bacterium]
MGHHVYKKTELVGTSSNSIEEAIESAIARASKTVRKIRWFEVVETRGQVQDGRVTEYQVTLSVGFTLD